MTWGKKKTQKRPWVSYASIASSFLGSRRVRCFSPAALRTLLRANADYNPGRNGDEPKLLLLTNELPGHIRVEKPTLKSAIEELMRGEVLERTASAIRPGGAGSSAGARAAEYDLPQRRKGCRTRFDQSDRQFEGAWRIRTADLRGIVADDRLTDRATIVLVAAILPQHRQATGEIMAQRVTSITAAGVAKLLEDTPNAMSVRSIERALNDLLSMGLVERVSPAIGRRAATYSPAGLAAAGVPAELLGHRRA